MEYFIRELEASEYPLLAEFLYQAIFQKDEEHPISRRVIEEPALNIYIKNFGSYQEDFCLCAEFDRKVVGAVWVRNIDGFGSIDDQTPEFAISLLPQYRGYGIGTALMREMLKRLKEKRYAQVSLAVQKENYVFRMYTKVGFEIITETAEEYIMVCRLN
ncbi:GNAT family N-acetyltransferase [Candidatus Enterococcus murrayae]|uniref:GNAT family N-acetyltransferase n=1 Tax=Candidatus Enterococcus murrayae TaxID=2815321 RepID=A0ABS3HNA4_9ENTE|nr:N-acetyltransferase [Enterococcus sp. MJM16]MBO0454939.1 GNAT family N-acetyltransferase [Enterococcus sp. MJM16]